MPIKMETREYRQMTALQPIDVRSAGDEPADEMVVEGYATTFDTPYVLFRDGKYTVREQVAADAFDGCDMTDVIMQYDHQGRVFARMSNDTLKVDPDKHGLHVRALLGGTTLGRQLYEEIRGGYTDKMSFAFTVAEDKREETVNSETGEVDILRTITRITKLYDVSAVSLPANDTTEISAASARSYGEGAIAEAMEEIHAREERERRIAAIKAIKIGG